MGTRLELQSKLEELLGVKHVYYQPPSSVKIEYPAIIYSKGKIDKDNANNTAYRFKNRYDVIVVDKHPDNAVIQKLLMLPYCSYDRYYASDNLNHDSLILYF